MTAEAERASGSSPAQLRDAATRSSVGEWWRCRCGRPLYEHSRRRVPNAGHFEYPCPLTASGRFESSTLPAYGYDCNNGLLPNPT